VHEDGPIARLCALDALVASGLTYAGWRADVRQAEEHHVEWPVLVNDHLAGMARKHTAHRLDPALPRAGGDGDGRGGAGVSGGGAVQRGGKGQGGGEGGRGGEEVVGEGQE
jgi:hypothetical protein